MKKEDQIFISVVLNRIILEQGYNINNIEALRKILNCKVNIVNSEIEFSKLSYADLNFIRNELKKPGGDYYAKEKCISIINAELNEICANIESVKRNICPTKLQLNIVGTLAIIGLVILLIKLL